MVKSEAVTGEGECHMYKLEVKPVKVPVAGA